MAFRDLALSRDGAKEALIQALVSALPSQDSLEELAGDLGTSPKTGNDVRAVARKLVEEADSQSAIRLLLGGARAMRPTNEALIAFEARYARRCFDRGGVGTFDDVRRLDKLVTILVGMGDDGAVAAVEAAFAAAAKEHPPTWSELRVNWRVTCAGLVSLIAEQDATRPPPLLVFVRELQHRVQAAPVRSALDAWLKDVAEILHIAPSLIPMTANSASSRPRYLMVTVRPTQLRDGYLGVAWLWVNQEPKEVWRGSCPHLDALRDRLSAELERRGSRLERGLRDVPDESITYEFVLPRDLIDAEVDRWEIANGGLRLGALHRVVVRSYERIYEMPDRGWTKKWKAWESRAGTSVEWFDPASDRLDRGFRAKLAAPNVVAMASLGPFPSGEEDPLNVVLQMGVPIIVWPRRACPNARVQLEELMKHLGADEADACRALLELRRQAAEDHCTASRHAALIWDDALRRPPDTEDLEDPGE